jgi:hypothetical protein
MFLTGVDTGLRGEFRDPSVARTARVHRRGLGGERQWGRIRKRQKTPYPAKELELDPPELSAVAKGGCKTTSRL